MPQLSHMILRNLLLFNVICTHFFTLHLSHDFTGLPFVLFLIVVSFRSKERFCYCASKNHSFLVLRKLSCKMKRTALWPLSAHFYFFLVFRTKCSFPCNICPRMPKAMRALWIGAYSSNGVWLKNLVYLFRDGRAKVLKGILRAFGKGLTAKDLEKPPRRPGGRGLSNAPWVRIGPFWLEGGPIPPVDAAQLDPVTKQRRWAILVWEISGYVETKFGLVAKLSFVVLMDSFLPTVRRKTSFAALATFIRSCDFYVWWGVHDARVPSWTAHG